MPLTKNSKEKIPEDLWGVYETLMEIAFGDEDVSLVNQVCAPDAFMIGTAEHEMISGQEDLIAFFHAQRKGIEGVDVIYKRIPVHAWFPTRHTFCIIDEYDMILDGEISFRMRLTVFFKNEKDAWVCTHIHASAPDRNVPTGDFWPIEELKRQNQILEQAVKSRTRELEIEAAVAKVRTKALAMRTPDDIMGALLVLKESIANLNLQTLSPFVWIQKSDTVVRQYDITETDDKGGLANFNFEFEPHNYPQCNKGFKKLKSNQDYFVTEFKGEDLLELANEIEAIDSKSGVEIHGAIESGFLKTYHQVVAKNKYGAVGLDFNTKPPKEVANILPKFSQVFEIAYERFLELRRAEAQAREAQIEAAVEKVRARAMGMQKPEDILQVLLTLRACLTDLKLETLAAVILIPDNNGSITQWDVTKIEDGKQELIHAEMDLTQAPMIKKMYRRAEKNDFTVLHVPGKELKKFGLELSTFNRRNGEIFIQAVSAGAVTEFYTTLHKFSHGFFELDFNKEPSQEIATISFKMAAAFDQAYTRFLDLQKAEAQTREALIELSLERIRAQASAMQQSTDLLDIMVMMRTEFVKLGHEAHYFWHMKWLTDTYEKAMTSGDGTKIGMVMKLPKHIHGDIAKVAKWEKSKEPILIFPMKVEQAVEYVDKMISLGDFEQVDPQAPTLDDVRAIGGLTFIMARTSHGEIGYSLPGYVENPPEEALKILKRFSGAFDLAYRRFEDLKHAEEQAREAQIEAAVERVRAEAMAMHQPDDLVKVNTVMLEEINNLGIENLTGAAFILFDQNDILTMWDISDPGNMGNVRDNKSIYDPREFDVLGDFWRQWKKGEDYFVIEYDFQTVNTALEEWKKVDYENYLNLKKAIDEDKLKTQWNPFASFSKGLLTLDLMSEPTGDTQNIMVKMARTFDLAYQRFDDLQKAEEQALQAKTQASLDRIRAEIASMRNQSDLEKLTPFIWMELSSLGVSFFRCGIFIMDSGTRTIDMYLSTPLGDSLPVMTLEFTNSDITQSASGAWESQETYREKWTKDQFIDWSKGLVQQGLVDSAQTYQFSDAPPENLCLQFLPFKQGMLYIGTEEYLDQNDLELVQDVADAFSIAYTRYEDFERLEKAKAVAENALGNLRSTQSQLIHAEKMASLGELTAGIAHEIQNPLNFVNNFSDLNKELIADLKEALAEGDLEEVEALMEDLKGNEEKIIHHGRRAEDIVKGMLAHSRSGDGKKELTDINALADEFLRLSYHGLRAKDKSFNANFVADLDKSLPKIKVVSQDLGRVILNLINNAFHATAEKLAKVADYKPEVMVATKREDNSVKIMIQDNGSGIPEKIREKIFQPFFTTKATGSGTGLGLSLSHDIVVKGHNGKIDVQSKEGEGTTFLITLPIT